MQEIGKLRYNRDNVIGKGRYGTVYKAEYEDCKDVAVKRVLKLSASQFEIDILRLVEHRNILFYYGKEENEDFVFIVTERCQGTLKDLVLGRREELGICYDVYVILRQITKGLKHLHEKGIVHRDLKPANILVSYPIHGDQPLMKLADFGLCHVVQNSDQSEFCFSKIAGTEGWMAPEMHYKEITERFTYLVDIFPLGLIFAFTLSGGQHPYGSSSIDRVNRIINNEPMTLTEDQLGEHATYNVFELIKSMLNYEPKKRPCASAILHHQFLNRVKQQQLLDVLDGADPKYVCIDSASPANSASAMFQFTEHMKPSSLWQKIQREMENKSLNLKHRLIGNESFAFSITKGKIQFDRSEKLGVGGCGTVFLGTFNKTPVAVKRVEKVRARNNIAADSLLYNLDHTNVIKLFHAEHDEDFEYFALELGDASLDQLFLEEGNPRKYIGPLPSEQQVLTQLANGLNYIHSKQLVHRDIKPGNILIVSSFSNQVTVKWTDFGFSKPVNERGSYSLSQLKGTLIWMAPELLQLFDDQVNLSEYRGTIQNDVFSAGCVFFYFASKGIHPYGTTLGFETALNIKTQNLVNGSKLSVDHFAHSVIVDTMLSVHPEQRSNWINFFI